MIKEAIDRILELKQPPTFKDAEGIERETRNGTEIRPPKMHRHSGCSLDSAIDIANRSVGTGVVYIECSYTVVDVRLPYEFNKYSANRWLHECLPILPDPFPFGRALDTDRFIIHASDFFERNEQYQRLIATVSSIVEVNESITDDDGISQAVTLKNRIGRKNSGMIEPYVKLRAYRTFREVEQPESTYLLRIGKGHDGPVVTLHEASGYQWKIAATDAVYEYVKERVGDSVQVVR